MNDISASHVERFNNSSVIGFAQNAYPATIAIHTHISGHCQRLKDIDFLTGHCVITRFTSPDHTEIAVYNTRISTVLKRNKGSMAFSSALVASRTVFPAMGISPIMGKLITPSSVTR